MAALNDGAVVQLSELLRSAHHYEQLLDQATRGYPHHPDSTLAAEYCELGSIAYQAAARVAESLSMKQITGTCDGHVERLDNAARMYREAMAHARSVYGLEDNDPS